MVYVVGLVNCLFKRWALSAFMVAWNLLNLIELWCVCVGLSCLALRLYSKVCVCCSGGLSCL